MVKITPMYGQTQVIFANFCDAQQNMSPPPLNMMRVNHNSPSLKWSHAYSSKTWQDFHIIILGLMKFDLIK